jgi:hypothetical protein
MVTSAVASKCRIPKTEPNSRTCEIGQMKDWNHIMFFQKAAIITLDNNLI